FVVFFEDFREPAEVHVFLPGVRTGIVGKERSVYSFRGGVANRDAAVLNAYPGHGRVSLHPKLAVYQLRYFRSKICWGSVESIRVTRPPISTTSDLGG